MTCPYVADEEDTGGMDASCDGTEWAVEGAYSFYEAWDLNGLFGCRIAPHWAGCGIGDGVVSVSACTVLVKLSVLVR